MEQGGCLINLVTQVLQPVGQDQAHVLIIVNDEDLIDLPPLVFFQHNIHDQFFAR
jgi:hypothetical protein